MNLTGHKASPGFATGKAYWLKKFKPSLSEKITESIAAEISNFSEALKKADQDLQSLQSGSSKESHEILEAHLMLLNDPEVFDKTKSLIEEKKISASKAYSTVIEEFKSFFASVEDDYLKQRVLDLDDISQRVLFYIENPKSSYGSIQVTEPSVLIAEDLTPSEILSFDKSKILAFATALGGGNSHTAILARSLEIPALVGVGENLFKIKSGEKVFLDSVLGTLASEISDNEESEFIKRRTDYEKKTLELKKFKGLKSLTKDQVQLMLSANISGPQDLVSFENNDAEAVGLYRTEFLYLDRKSQPTEDEQYKVYSEVVRGLKGKRIHIRSLDIGGDKSIDYLNLPKEENPFLGLRAIRLCLQKPELFKTQLRALLRATVNAPWGLMFPMIAEVDELQQALKMVEEAKAELKARAVPFCQDFEVGIMVEIPSMAWLIDHVAPMIDFVSLGTNDLLQYTCAADRLNKDLKYVYNPMNPGFLRQINHIVKESLKYDIHVSICGSLSHHELLMPFLIGCGVQELSMTSQHILSTRKRLSEMKMSDCQALVSEILKIPTATLVEKRLKEFCK